MTGGAKTVQTQDLKLPEWLNKGAEGTFTQAQAAAAANPVEAYKGPTAPGSNANLDAASARALASTAGQSDLDKARAYTSDAVATATPHVSTDDWNTERFKTYSNPNLEAVQGRVLADMKRANEGEIADLGDRAQTSKAYGGTRNAVLEAETRKGQGANMLDYLAKSNQENYDDAYGKFNADRSARMSAEGTNAGITQGDMIRLMQAGSQSAGIGTTAAGLDTQGIDNLVRTGAVQQGTEGGQIAGDYDEFMRMQDAPMERYMQLMQMLSGAPSDKSTKSTTKQKQDPLAQLLGAGVGIASLVSDRRLKRSIVRVGSSRYGGIYEYRYVWGRKRHIGFMADEVKRVVPEAVSRAFGFDMIDYGMLARA